MQVRRVRLAESSAAGVVDTLRLGRSANRGFESVCGKAQQLRKVDGRRPDRHGAAEVRRRADRAAGDEPDHGRLDQRRRHRGSTRRRQGRPAASSDLYVSGQGADPSAWCLMKNNPQWVGTRPTSRRVRRDRRPLPDRPDQGPKSGRRACTCRTWSSTRPTCSSTTSRRAASPA